MTWFEAEESAKYLTDLENALDDWKYDNMRLRAELAELTRIEKRFKSSYKHSILDSGFVNLAEEVLMRAKHCRHEIRERLMA